MADMAIGLSKTVVEGAITKVQAAIEEDAKLRQKAQRDLVAISLEFEMMQSFLQEVAKEESVTNSMVKTWVKHVRDLAYDLEDCVEFVVHLDNTPDWWQRLLPSCMAPPLPLDQAVVELEELKRRVEDVNSCYRRYSKINDAGSGKLVRLQQRGVTDATAFVKGRDDRKIQQGDLAELLVQDYDRHYEPLRVISVWGTHADLGVISIIWKAYHDQEICQIFTRRAWVKLMHPFNPHEFVRCLKDQFYASACRDQDERVIGLDVLERTSEATQGDHLKEFEKQLKNESYLVVLEDVPTLADWDSVSKFFPKRNNGSRIIISTQQSEVASLSVGHHYQMFDLNSFSVDHHPVYAFYSEGPECVGNEVKTFSANKGDYFFKQREASEWISYYPLVGRKSEINDLRRCTSKARFESFQVMSVWGIPGVGKSALVKDMFCKTILTDCSLNDENKRNIFDKYGWVDLSHPFNLRDFARSLLLNFRSEFLQSKEMAHNGMEGIGNPVEKCWRILQRGRCLVVIDGLRSTKDWDLIQAHVLSESSRNCIVVITTEVSIATHCCRDKRELLLGVKCLDADASFQLFMKKVTDAGYRLPSSLPDFIVEELQKLVSKCGGLPEVIAAIASSLGKKSVGRMEYASSLSQKFMHDLECTQEFYSLQGLFGRMHTCFRTCPDSVQPCIFYLPIFPRGLVIRRRRLVRRWIAEGYSRDSHAESAEDNGEKYFSILLDMYILQQPTLNTDNGDTRMVACKVNGFMHEYIVSRHMEENLVFELGGSCALTTQRTGRHLTILEHWERDKIVFNSIDFSRLRSLTVFGKWESFFISKSMKLLRVLDLEDASDVNDADLEKIMNLLGRLKFLSLRGCQNIFNLPSSLGDMRQLQTIDVRGTFIVTLPENIIKLQKLEYIRAGRKTTQLPPVPPSWLPKFCKRRQLVGVVVPKGIGKLTALHTLGVFELTASGGKDVLDELNELTQLRKLGVSGVNRKNIKDFFSAISDHVHLQTLSVHLDNDSQDCLDDIDLTSKNLRSLKLYGLSDKFPQWSDQLWRLAKLDLEMATLTEGYVMKILGMLPQLCILRVKPLQDGELHFRVIPNEEEVYSYKKLKVLKIVCGCSSSTLHVKFGNKTMKKLELLMIDCCGGSPPYQFSGLENLKELDKVLLVSGPNYEELKQHLEDQLAKHPSEEKPVVKLEKPQRSS